MTKIIDADKLTRTRQNIGYNIYHAFTNIELEAHIWDTIGLMAMDSIGSAYSGMRSEIRSAYYDEKE